MADNISRYGFRWAAGYNGGKNYPTVEERWVPSSPSADASFDVSGGQSNLYLGKGDLVKLEATGGVTLCQVADNDPYGVVMGVLPYWDGTKMVPSRLLPSDIAWGTNLARQSKVLVAPIVQGAWEVDVDDAVTATTETAYQSLVNLNVDFILSLTNTTRPEPKLDISSAATTAGLHFRIIGLGRTPFNQDYSGANVKLVVIANQAQHPAYGTTGLAGI